MWLWFTLNPKKNYEEIVLEFLFFFKLQVVEAADEAVVDQPMAKVAPKNKQGKKQNKSKFQQQISNKERKESRSTLKNI